MRLRFIWSAGLVPGLALLAVPSTVAATTPASAAISPNARLAPAPTAGVKLTPIPAHIGGRVLETRRGAERWVLRQWPGTYYQTAFHGPELYFLVGAGDTHLQVSVDDILVGRLQKPAPGFYRVSGLTQGPHRMRVDMINESQERPSEWGGFYAPPGVTHVRRALGLPRQIEFIGDSHSVGYGNMSAKRDCSPGEVWASTNSLLSPGAIVAGRLGADYQINAISGRGVVRNYDGAKAPTLPEAYPFALFDRRRPSSEPGWRPDLVVIGLGTNDFSTPLKPGERWTSRRALQADFRARYKKFVQSLRSRRPQARFVLWATDLADGEIAAQVEQVVRELRAEGARTIEFASVRGLAMSGCHYHPSVADAERIAGAIIRAADQR